MTNSQVSIAFCSVVSTARAVTATEAGERLVVVIRERFWCDDFQNTGPSKTF